MVDRGDQEEGPGSILFLDWLASTDLLFGLEEASQGFGF